MLTGATDLISLATSQTVPQVRQRHAKWVRTMIRTGVRASQISSSPARLVQAGLEPIHSRATANATRLGKLPRAARQR
jgi:hypothetical protein